MDSWQRSPARHGGLRRKPQEALPQRAATRDRRHCQSLTRHQTQKKAPKLSESRGFQDRCLAVTYSRTAKPHYHRRWRVSLPSSGWDRVVPRRYCRQAKSIVRRPKAGAIDPGLDPGPPCHWQGFRDHRDRKFCSKSADCVCRNWLWCYMTKPHGQLVLVSFMHYCTSTPSLSTW